MERVPGSKEAIRKWQFKRGKGKSFLFTRMSRNT